MNNKDNNKDNNKVDEMIILNDLACLSISKKSEGKSQCKKSKSNWYAVPSDFDYWGGINLNTNFI